MRKRILSLLLAILMLFGMFPPYNTYAVEIGKEVTVWYFNSASEVMEEAGTVELYRGGELYLSAILRDDISGSVQWQIEAGQDFWVDIQGGTTEDLRVSYGMVKSLLNNDTVRMRCTVSDSNESFYSDPVTVYVTDTDNRAAVNTFIMEQPPVAPDPLPAPTGISNVSEEAEPTVTEETAPSTTAETTPVVTEETAPSATEETEIVIIPDESIPLTTVSTESVRLLSSASAIPMTDNTNLTNEDTIIYTVTIEYVYADSSKFAGQRVALPYIAEVAAGSSLSETVISPNCVGYNPNLPEIVLKIDSAYGNVSYTVKYSPAEVSYTVRHYRQNVNDDEYTWVDTTIATGYTEALTSDSAANSYTGFTALTHYHEEIAADSSTMIDIYYDRNYYLMSFNLDGGYGVAPIYARYDAPISVGNPYKPGYTFDGWDASVPTTMPAESRNYTAKWTANSGISYTVAYWLEDANTDGKYNFWASAQRSDADAGDIVQGETYKDYTAYLDTATVSTMDTYEKRYSEYSHADTYVTIEGDGSTVVNVYYNRKEYTLKFYYAARTGTEGAYTYKIYGGSTYFFGQDNNHSYNGDEMELLNAIYTNVSYAHQWGTITEAPKFNTNGASRNYKLGADSKNNVDFLYLSFTAKYGADISELWPCNVFEAATRVDTANASNWSGTAAYVSAWNGEHHVYYSHHAPNGNETIKGNYNELDYQLLFDNCGTHTYADSSTVAYLCFWENGSGNVSWNIPELYRYNIFVPVLDEQGKYELYATYDTVDNSSVDQQTPPAINGFTYINHYTSETLHKVDTDGNIIANATDNPILYDEQGNRVYSEAYAVNFYYSREVHNLKFVNGTKEISATVAFGTDISGKAPTDLEYFDASLKDLYVFDGWYTTPDAIPDTDFDLDGATMPDSALTLYANWMLISHDVKIYPTEEDAKNDINQIGNTIPVTHDEPIPEVSRPARPADTEAETFIGWFYKDENGEEQAFDFATMTITKEMTIYAKWRSNVMKQVEVYYVVEDEDGTKTQIADTETLMLRLGQTRTFDAKTGGSLYAEYSTGCFPTTATHSITPTDADLNSENPLTYAFVYKQYGAVPYQVEFYVVDKDGTKRPAFKQDENAQAVFMETYDSTATAYVEQHWQNDKAVVTELHIPDNLAVSTWTLPDEYLPNALKIQKIIVPSETDPTTNIEANIIKFIYTYTEPVVDPDNPDNPDPGTPVYEARYLVQHFIQNSSDTTKYDLYSYSDEQGLSGETAIASAISIPGYTFSSAETDARKQTDTTLGADNTVSGTITADDKLELNFYYTVNSYPYQVMYVEEGTNRVLEAAKTTDTDGKQLTGLYGSKVTESAIGIDGYDVVGSATKTIYIQMEAGTTASVNTIVFYYKLKSAELVLTKSVKLDETQAAQEGISEIPSWVYDQEFVFTVYQSEGYPKSVYHYTFTGTDGSTKEKTVNAGVQTIVVSLKHGESIQFHDFPMGTYTVTETYVPGFRTSVDGYIAQAHTVTLDADGEVGTLNFLNTFPFYTGDLVIKKNVTKLGENDPTATEPYKVTVVLNPDASTREVDRVVTFVDKDGNALTDANNNSSFTIPKLTGTDDQTQFTITLLVPVGGEVKMEGVPVGSFTATEEVKGTIGYIYDFYTVKYNKAVHENDEVTGTNHVVSGSIHGGHPTAVTFNNTYKKGNLTINKTVTQEYEKDSWQSDTFTFAITGTTELPDGNYAVDGATVTVSDGVVTVKDADRNDPKISITKTDAGTSWSSSLTFENLPAGYYTVTETAGLGNDKYTAVGPEDSLLVNDTTTATVADFTNTYKRHYADLIIITTCADNNQSFVFDVTSTDSSINLQVVLVGNDSQTIKDLPVGNYTVTEQTEWSWRENAVENKTVELQAQSETVPFAFDVVDRIYWLSGYSYNIRKEGGS